MILHMSENKVLNEVTQNLETEQDLNNYLDNQFSSQVYYNNEQHNYFQTSSPKTNVPEVIYMNSNP